MQETAVLVLSIHDHQNSVLAFDLKEVLQALGKYSEKWTWCITRLECIGREDSETMCQAVETAGASGIWASWQELVKLADKIDQTIEGELLAFPADIDKRTIAAADLDLGVFPTSKAELAIVVVDSSYFEIYAKDPGIAATIRGHFQEVYVQDPSKYFCHS